MRTFVRAALIAALCLSPTAGVGAADFLWLDGATNGDWVDPNRWQGGQGYPDGAGVSAEASLSFGDIRSVDDVTVGSLSISMSWFSRIVEGSGLTFDNAGAPGLLSITDTWSGTGAASRCMAPIALTGDLHVIMAGDRPFELWGGVSETSPASRVTLLAPTAAGSPALHAEGGVWTITGGLYLSGGPDAARYATFADNEGVYAGEVHMSGFSRYVTDFPASATLESPVVLSPACHAVLGRINTETFVYNTTYTGVISGQADELRIYTTGEPHASPNNRAVTLGGDQPNTYSGPTVLEATRGGKVVAAKDGAFGNSYRITVLPHTELHLGDFDTIDDTASLYLRTDGSDPARVVLPEGVREIVSALYLWDPGLSDYVRQAGGTWGSTASWADHRSDEWFSGAGVLSVGAYDPGQLPGDADGNDRVDAADYLLVKGNLGTQDGAQRGDGDFDGDGDVDRRDLEVLVAHMGQSAPALGGASAPEPASLLILTAGVAMMLSRRRAYHGVKGARG